MSRQTFDTTAQLRLEVEAEPAAGQALNLIRDSESDYGAWEWVSPVPNTRVYKDDIGVHSTGVSLATFAAQAAYFTTLLLPVAPTDTHVRATYRQVGGTSSAIGMSSRLRFHDVNGTILSETANTAIVTTSATVVNVPLVALPANTRFVSLRLDLYRSGSATLNANDYMKIRSVAVFAGVPTAGVLNGSVARPVTNILGSSNEITVDRAELNLGTLTAVIRDAALDPSQSQTIRAGKRIRLRRNAVGSELFTGTILKASVRYYLTNPNVGKRARIELTAVDQAQPLANTIRPNGVAEIVDLPYVLEGCGVPWNVNGDVGHRAYDPAIASVNDNAAAVDQIAITRDSNLGYAWFDREGVVQAWDASLMDTTSAGTIDEDVYNPEIVVDYDTDRCINHVTVKYLRPGPSGDTTEVVYGPYLDLASIAKWGTHAAEFTVHGIPDDEASISAYAAAILTANATPAVRIVECTIPLNTTADLTAWALLDLYDLPTVANTDAGISEPMRVTRLTHRITGNKWLLTVGFTTEGGVAQPQVTPSPPTLVSGWWPEVLMLYGSPAKCPAGYLVMDGGTFDAAAYPELAAHLVSLGMPSGVLPNMTDVFPIGAGTKAIGTNGGAATKPVPPHTHPMTHDHAAGSLAVASVADKAAGTQNRGGNPITGSTGGSSNANTGAAAGSSFDVMPPWRAVYFIIRAR